ncbi:MAG: NAD(P)H-dependent oxidoreductase [Deltaproteobacteria bacterium]|nr:NAD(P)H-dependent oxidoreductase [Deltaproteobacteria bacterium]MBW1846426.1 NAD(P)H-dependent oxidoreductase [Deltaproteobacteria bacterium]MBW2180624.1 NAD(P)H-dependent oxidoreductase [Deltaproteobacteria bacterium]
MLALGLFGSPRKKGNTAFLLNAFLEEIERHGVQTQTIDVCKMNIQPCKGCAYCEKYGFCVIDDDDMRSVIYPLLRKADIVITATPIFFYSATAQLKALIDRSQALWSRRYKFDLFDPFSKFRRGFLLSLGATKGKNLFDGVILTTKYFYDAVNASYEGSLTYRHIENPGDMKLHPSVLEDIKNAAKDLIDPVLNKKRILFACVGNTCRSQMAGAFAQIMFGDKVDVLTGGSQPEELVNPVMEEVMREKGIDMAYRKPQSINDAIENTPPDWIITMGCGEECPFVPGAKVEDWNINDPAGQPIEFMRKTRDEIEEKVKTLIPNKIK